MPFLSFIEPIFAWNVPLVSLIFLKRSLVFPILLFPLFLWIAYWGRLSYLSFLLFGTQHSNGYIFPFLLCFSFPVFSQLFLSPPQRVILAFLHFFFLGMVLIPVSCIVSWTSIHSSSGTLSIRSRPLNLFSTFTVYCKGFHYKKTLHMNITRWSTLKSDWLYSLQSMMEKLYTVSKNKTRGWLWLRLWTPYCQIQT